MLSLFFVSTNLLCFFAFLKINIFLSISGYSNIFKTPLQKKLYPEPQFIKHKKRATMTEAGLFAWLSPAVLPGTPGALGNIFESHCSKPSPFLPHGTQAEVTKTWPSSG